MTRNAAQRKRRRRAVHATRKRDLRSAIGFEAVQIRAVQEQSFQAWLRLGGDVNVASPGDVPRVEPLAAIKRRLARSRGLA